MRLSANIETLQPSATIAVSTLAKRLASEGRDVINLSAGEPDFDTPDFISERAIEGIRAGRTRYTPPAGLPELRKAIAGHLATRAGADIDWNGVVVTTGAKQALFNVIFSLFGPGDEVLIPAPYWTSYPELVGLARAESVAVPGNEDDALKVDVERLEEARTPSTRGLILNTPCNPTGAVYTLDELTAIMRWAAGHDVWVISDEIYRRIYHEEGRDAAPGVLDVPASDRGPFVLIDGASKSYAMTGWRMGFSYSNVDLATACTSLQSQITSNVATPTQVAAIAAFSEVDKADDAVSLMAGAFRRRRDLVVDRMRALMPGVPFIDPRGAFYLFFRVDGMFDDDIRDATAWCSHLLQETGVALVPGAAFGDDRWVRMSYAASDHELEEALKRIASVAMAEAEA